MVFFYVLTFDYPVHTGCCLSCLAYKFSDVSWDPTGTHAAFQEVVRDLEEMRNKAISDAKAFGDYQLECVQKQYELDSEAVEEEYQVQCCMVRHGLPFIKFGKLISLL
jgi:Sds3-like